MSHNRRRRFESINRSTDQQINSGVDQVGSTGRRGDGRLRVGLPGDRSGPDCDRWGERERFWASFRGSTVSDVPDGFCVTTDAYRRILKAVPSIDVQLDRLSRLDPGGRKAIRALSAEIRRAIEGIAIPGDLASAITGRLARRGGQAGYAIRSSATAEDSPAPSPSRDSRTRT